MSKNFQSLPGGKADVAIYEKFLLLGMQNRNKNRFDSRGSLRTGAQCQIDGKYPWLWGAT